MIRKTLVAGSFAFAAMIGTSAQSATFDLGFIMDRSNSIADSDFNDAMHSLAAALGSALAPTIGSADTYTVSVVTFASSASDVITRTINTQADLDAVVAAVNAAATGTSGATNYQAGFNELANNFTSLGDFSLINMMTDGDPNLPSGSAVSAALSARTALHAAGWDSLSFEAVGAGISDPNLLRRLAFDTNSASLDDLEPLLGDPSGISDPLNDAFVLQVANFGSDYDAAIKAKVGKIVNPGPNVPIPASLPLLAGGLALFGYVGRRKMRKAA